MDRHHQPRKRQEIFDEALTAVLYFVVCALILAGGFKLLVWIFF